REVGDALGAVRKEIHRNAAERLASDRALDRVLDPALDLERSIPPAALPQRLADHVRGGISALLERRPVRVEQRAFEIDAPGEDGLIVDRAKLGHDLAQLSVRGGELPPALQDFEPQRV